MCGDQRLKPSQRIDEALSYLKSYGRGYFYIIFHSHISIEILLFSLHLLQILRTPYGLSYLAHVTSHARPGPSTTLTSRRSPEGIYVCFSLVPEQDLVYY